jgi:hypothetical protein
MELMTTVSWNFYQMLIQINCSAGIQRSYYESREAIDDPTH